MKVAIYLRTSTEEQNPENQLKDCKSVCDGLNMKEYEVLQEQESAFKDDDKREVFNSIQKGIKKGDIKNIIVWDLDRIYRNRKKLTEFFSLCNMYKCKIYAFRQRWLEDLNRIPEPFNEIMHGLMLQIMGWLAEEESRKKSERVKSAVRTKNGVTESYKGNKWGRKSISTQKLNKLREYYELDKNKSIREIAKDLKMSKSAVHKYIQQFVEEKTIRIDKI